jgi:hypothetical protein
MPPSFAMEELIRGIKIILDTKDNSMMWKVAMNVFHDLWAYKDLEHDAKICFK